MNERDDPEPQWLYIPFLGESLPDPVLNAEGAHALAESRRAAWRLRQWRLKHGTSDAGANDAEVMAFDDWHVLWTVTENGELVSI